MQAGAKLSIGALGRLATAAAAAYAGTQLPGSPNLGAALAAVASGYLINRANRIEEEFEEQLRASPNHHLQLALAGALRNTLQELQQLHPAHQSLFDSWHAILNAALDHPTTLLPALIPAKFDPLLDAANPHTGQAAALDEAESLLRFWLAYQQAFERTKAYPFVPPSPLPKLPADLRQSFRIHFLPTFQNAFAHLLAQNDSAYARRTFERRNLQELIGISRRLDAHLLLPLAPLRPPDPHQEDRELEVLRAENCAIPVIGRQSDLAGLHAWLESPAPISCRILTGPAGAGKTRLAIQFLEELAGSRWYGGFLRDPDLANLNQRHWIRPTLAIVDYAASAAQPLKTWLGHLADQSPSHPLRVLLLEREANPESGWLRLLLDHTSTGYRIASLLDPPAPQRVTPLTDPQLRRQILKATLEKLGVKSPLPPPGQDPLFDLRLAEPLWQDPLYLMMAALVARRPGGLPQALSLTRTDLAFRLADRELDRIRKFLPSGAPPESARLLTHLAGLVTACRFLKPVDLLQIAKEEATVLGVEFPGGPRVAADRISEALHRQGNPAPIEPDIIGEAVLLRSFGGENRNEGAPALVRAARRADHRQASSICSAITRTCQDFASDECQDPLDWLEAFIRTGESDDFGLLLELEQQMPHDTLVLRERAARVDQLLLTRFTQLREIEPSEQIQSMCAGLANNLGVRLSALGRREEALAQAEEAAALYRQLAQQRPDAFLPALARSLAGHGKIIAEDRPGEAMAPLAEAIRVLTPFVLRHPQVHAPLMRTIYGLYLRAGESANADLDLALLAPVIAVLEKLNPPEHS